MLQREEKGLGMDTDMRDAVEAGFVEAYNDHEEALAEAGRRLGDADNWRWVVLARETERRLQLSREQVKVLWS